MRQQNIHNLKENNSTPTCTANRDFAQQMRHSLNQRLDSSDITTTTERHAILNRIIGGNHDYYRHAPIEKYPKTQPKLKSQKGKRPNTQQDSEHANHPQQRRLEDLTPGCKSGNMAENLHPTNTREPDHTQGKTQHTRTTNTDNAKRPRELLSAPQNQLLRPQNKTTKTLQTYDSTPRIKTQHHVSEIPPNQASQKFRSNINWKKNTTPIRQHFQSYAPPDHNTYPTAHTHLQPTGTRYTGTRPIWQT